MAGIASRGSAAKGAWMRTMDCPNGHGLMEFGTMEKELTFRGLVIKVDADSFICPECGLEAGTPETAGKLQQDLADAYREKTGLLTGREIKGLRKARGLTQQQLAAVMNIGIASIKRWETGTIQSKSMDHALRMQMECAVRPDNYTGNREISLARIKLIAGYFEGLLGKKLLKKGDKFLYLAKYFWYADFLCFRELGHGLTGASYAAITYGPQFNNYKDLIDPIKASDEREAEPLSSDEVEILNRVVETFPEEQAVFDAAHREKIWKDRAIGALIPYSCAHELMEI